MITPSNVFGVPVNGFHPQLTAVSNPVGANDPPPPSWPSYVHPARSNTCSSGNNERPQCSFSSGSAQSSSASTAASSSETASDRNDCGPVTAAPNGATTHNAGTSRSSQIHACTATAVRRLQHDARESDRSRSKMLRKRVRREGKSQRRHLRRRRKQQQEELQRQQQGQRPSRRTSESTATGDSSMSSFSISFAATSSSSVSDLNNTTTSSRSSGSSDGGSSATSDKSKRRPSMLSPSSSGRSKQDTKSTTGTAAAHETHFSELYADVFMASDRPQFMATLGGRLVAWNDEFLSMTGVATSQLRGCMTVHNLIRSSYHPVLNDMFELALRGDFDVKNSPFMLSSSRKSGGPPATPPLVVVASRETTAMADDVARERQIAAAMAPPSVISTERSMAPRSDSELSDDNDAVAKTSDIGVSGSEATSEKEDPPASMGEEEKVENINMYASLTLPCVSFPRASTPLQMTIVLMNDIDPSRRCFYCIISPMDQVRKPSAPVTYTRDSHSLFSAFLLANQQQQQQQCGNSSQSEFMSGDAAKGFVIAPQTSVGVIRRIDQAELTSLL